MEAAEDGENMQLIGAHMSIAGGVQNAIDSAEELGCTAIQIFVKNARRLFDKSFHAQELQSWHEKLKKSVIVKSVIAHSGYLINLASPEQEKWERYIEALADELARCDQLGIRYLVLHPGSPQQMGIDWGIKRIAAAIDSLYTTGDFEADIALETTAGTGNHIGSRFEHLAEIISRSKHSNRLAIVFDTCHTFAAGYDFTEKQGYEQVIGELEKVVELKRLVAIHFNDSKHPLGSQKDRHEHIGNGFLGNTPFKMFLMDKRFEKIPKILETPKENDWDRKNLKILWELAGENPPVSL